MTEQLVDWADPGFIDAVLSKHPSPKGPDRIDEMGRVIVGEKLWPSGIRLHGNQRKIIRSRGRFIQVGGGWRGGKSFIGALKVYVDVVWRIGYRKVTDDLWGILADAYSMATEEMRHLDKLLSEGGIIHDFKTPENQAWRITFPGLKAEIVTMTASDVTKIASRPYRGIVIAEAAQTIYAAFENSIGRVSETRGWVMLEGTFESTKGPWYYQLAEAWKKPGAMGKFYSLPSWENLVVYPLGRDDPEIRAREKTMAPATFLEKYGGEPVKRSDLAIPYANERFQVAHRYPYLGSSYDPERPVVLYSDPGTAHAYAVWAVQFWGEGPRRDQMGFVTWVIDAVYRWGRDAQDIIAECANRPWAPSVYLNVMDFAARQRKAEGPPIIEQWAKAWPELTGNRLSVIANQVPLAAGYDITKRALLNAWPEDEANKAFNGDGKLRQMTDPYGPRLMFDPAAAAPVFGGLVDGVEYAGEFNLHRMRKNRDGTVTTDDYIDMDNDGIKALNYGNHWHYGPAGDRQKTTYLGAADFEVRAS